MNLSCDSTSANNKSNEEVCVEVPVKNLMKENDLNCLKDVTNELKVVNPFVICNKDNINEVISNPKKNGAGSNIIKNLVAVNTVDGELRNNKSNDDNTNNSVISNTTKCRIVAPIDVGAQDNVTKYPKAIEMEDEEYKTNKVMNLHENTEESQLKKAQEIAKPGMVQCFQNVDVVSSSTDNNSAKECEEFAIEVPLTNIDAGTEKTHSEDVVVLEDEVKDNKPDSTLSGAVHCDNTDVHSSDHINKEPVYATGSDNIDSNNTIITKARNKKIYEKKTHNYMECIKTIVLDDEQVEGDSEIIELDDKDNDCDTVEATSNKCNRQIYHNKGINIKRRHQYDEIYQCNTEMAELIEICLNMPNTDGMTRIIDKTLIPIFKDTAPDFKKSEEFKRALTKTITLLERHPLKKFSHIKNFCDILKKHKIKKRVSFITLQKKGGCEDSESNNNLAAKRRKVDAVIDLDDDNDVQVNETKNTTVHKKAVKEYPPIEIDDESSSDILMENGFVLIDSDHDDEVIIVDKKNNSNHTEPKRKRKHKRKNSKQSHKKFKEYKDKHKKWRENKQKQNEVSCVSVESNLRTEINDDILRTNSNDANKTNKISISNANGETNSQFQNEVPMSVGDLLMPRADKVMSLDHSDSEKIKSIEAQIARLKCRLDMYELMEVTSDTRLSPYLVCEELKALIVRLYKQLCKLTGTAEVKRHEVRLKVMPGHPEGPVRCFEEFLNQNINAEGNPPFPDIQDVIECVCRANYKYEMNLTQTQIMGEAHALFTQFGQEMQKRRQRREWKDLMSLVKQEMVDPANEDPVLQARLAENSLIAKKNEDDLLERYVNMERGIEHDPELRMDIEQSESDDSDMGVDPSEVNNETNTINCLPIISTVCTVNELDCNIVTEPTSGTPINNHESESDDFDMGVDPSEVDNEANTINSLPIISTVCTVNELDCNIVREPTSRTPVDNHPEFVNDALNLRTQTFGSKISIAGGNIIIEPTINAIPNTVGFEPKMTDMKAQSKSESDLVKDCMRRNAVVALNKTEFSSEFQHFIANIESKKRQAQEKVLIEERNAHIRNELSQKERTNYANMTANNTAITSNSAQSKLETASALAKTILSLVQSETNINEKSITNVNSGQVDGEFEIFTHIDVWKPVHINTELDKNKGSISNAINKELDNDTFVNVAQNFNTHSAEVSKDADTQMGSDVDNEERIVKSEPLDIPSMLEELGKDFSATIFDIEGADAFRDPFLVIDISDSSDSEAENI